MIWEQANRKLPVFSLIAHDLDVLHNIVQGSLTQSQRVPGSPQRPHEYPRLFYEVIVDN